MGQWALLFVSFLAGNSSQTEKRFIKKMFSMRICKQWLLKICDEERSSAAAYGASHAMKACDQKT